MRSRLSISRSTDSDRHRYELDVTLAQQTLQTARDSVNQLDLGYREAVRAVETLTDAIPVRSSRRPRRSLHSRIRCRPDCRASCSNGGWTSVPPNIGSRQHSRRSRKRARQAADDHAERRTVAISSDLFVLDKRDDIVKSIGGTVYLPIFNAIS
jgi:hypothetical protein